MPSYGSSLLLILIGLLFITMIGLFFYQIPYREWVNGAETQDSKRRKAQIGKLAID